MPTLSLHPASVPVTAARSSDMDRHQCSPPFYSKSYLLISPDQAATQCTKSGQSILFGSLGNSSRRVNLRCAQGGECPNAPCQMNVPLHIIFSSSFPFSYLLQKGHEEGAPQTEEVVA